MNRRLALSSFRATKLEFGQVPDPEREVGPFGDQVLVAVRHHQIDLQERMPGQERRQQRDDLPGAVARRKGDPQDARQAVGPARRVLGVVDGEEGLARPPQQGFAGVGRRHLPRGADQKLDAEPALERRDRP